VIRKMDRIRELDLAVLDGPFIGRGLHGCYFTPRPEIRRRPGPALAPPGPTAQIEST
jgi:hypothetical protein